MGESPLRKLHILLVYEIFIQYATRLLLKIGGCLPYPHPSFWKVLLYIYILDVADHTFVASRLS